MPPVPHRLSIPALIALACLGVGCSADPATEEVPELTSIELVENERSTISCYLRWTTDEPAASRVEFGETTDYEFAIAHDTLVTEHEVTVYGMRADTTYHMRAAARTEDGTLLYSEDFEYTTGALPFDTLQTDLTVQDVDRIQPGWTLTNLSLGEEIQQVAVVIFDRDGEVVWYYEVEGETGRADVEVSLVEFNRILIGGALAPGLRPVEVNMGGEIRWAGPEQTVAELSIGGMHHCFQKLVNGEYITMFFDFHEGLVDVIEQFDEELEETWTWNTFEYLPDSETTYPQGNALFVDLDDNATYYNAHVAGTLYKIDRSNGQVLWSLGEGRDFELIGDEGDWFLRTHAPQILDDGNVLFYDNGEAWRGYSRIVEYAIDVDEMTVELVWEYPGGLADDVWYNRVWGEAERLANGNTLITAGSAQEGDAPGRLMEVTPEGDKVWELWLGSSDEGERAGSYRSERIPELVERM
jgi:arylsulfate sulfotransferase